jgi:hypothetical protein
LGRRATLSSGFPEDLIIAVRSSVHKSRLCSHLDTLIVGLTLAGIRTRSAVRALFVSAIHCNDVFLSFFLSYLQVRLNRRLGPELCKVAVVPEHELRKDDVLDNGVKDEVGEADEATEDRAKEKA